MPFLFQCLPEFVFDLFGIDSTILLDSIIERFLIIGQAPPGCPFLPYVVVQRLEHLLLELPWTLCLYSCIDL